MEKFEPAKIIKMAPGVPQESREISDNAMFAYAAGYLRKNAINPDNFIDIYGKDSIDADKAKAAAIKSEEMRMATVMEAMITENIDQHGWLGEKTEARPAAPFDDCVNGIDALTIFKKEGGFEKYMGLVMDATFNPSEKLRGKFNAIRGGIVRGALGTLKYFESGKVRGRMSHISKVVVGLTEKTVKELGCLMVTARTKEISEHPAQFQVLEEIAMQLKIFAEYARSQPNDMYYEKSDKDIRAEMVKIYEEAHDLISGILEQRRAVVKDTGKRDEMYDIIKAEAEKLLTQNSN